MAGGRGRFLIVLITSLGVALLLIIAPLFIATPPTYCKGCHKMEPYYNSWKVSTHGQVRIRCESCHVKPEFLSRVLFKLNFYGAVYGELFNQKLKPWAVTNPPLAACRQCHSLNRERSTSGDLKISHRIHVVEAKLKCTFCHSGAVHPDVGKLGKMNPPRKLCVKCHEDQIENCSYCHVVRKGELGEFRQFQHL